MNARDPGQGGAARADEINDLVSDLILAATQGAVVNIPGMPEREIPAISL